MDLLLLRHGDAQREAPSDVARRLTEKGQRQSNAVAKYLESIDWLPDRIVTSPVVRAVETAAIVQDLLGSTHGVTEDERLACGMRPEDAYAVLFDLDGDERVMFVGHEPDFSGLVGDLTAMESAMCVEIKKASLCFLYVEMPARGGGTLETLIPPKRLP